MTVIPLRSPAPTSPSLIDAAITLHGPLPVLRAALLALLKRKRKPRHDVVCPSLRRDLGLPPVPPELPRHLGSYGPFL